MCYHDNERMSEKRMRFLLGATIYNQDNHAPCRRSPRHVTRTPPRRSWRLTQPEEILPVAITPEAIVKARAKYTPARKRRRLKLKQHSLLPTGRPRGSVNVEEPIDVHTFAPQDWQVLVPDLVSEKTH